MGKGILRMIGRIFGICLLFAALFYGVQWVEQLPISTYSYLLQYILSGLLWILVGFLLPFLTARSRGRLSFSLECALCCVLCLLLAAGISRVAWIFPLFLKSRSGLLQNLLLLTGGVFLHRTLFRTR